jgi:y4mF family transcriptional regulator
MTLNSNNYKTLLMDTRINDIKHLGETIRNARKLQALTQEDLAGIVGTGRRFISDIENGKETAEIGKVFLVLRTLGMALDISSKWSE